MPHGLAGPRQRCRRAPQKNRRSAAAGWASWHELTAQLPGGSSGQDQADGGRDDPGQRRDGAWAVVGAATRHLRADNARPQTLLILGGTGFLGPPLTQEALRRGWKVTHFNRGKHAAGGVAGVETLIGDRRGELDSLRGRKWDAVVDDTGFVPKFVKMSA